MNFKKIKIASSLFLSVAITSTTFQAKALEEKPLTPSFYYPDVMIEDPYHKSIETLTDLSLLEGYEDGLFRPDKKVSRAEMLKLAYKANDMANIIAANLEGEKYDSANSYNELIKSYSGEECFDDISGHWATDKICFGKSEGHIEGDEGTNLFNPERRVNLAETAKMLGLSSMEELVAGREWYAPYLESLQKKYAIPSSVLSADQEITRAEAAEIVYRFIWHTKGLPNFATYNTPMNLEAPHNWVFVGDFYSTNENSSDVYFKNEKIISRDSENFKPLKDTCYYNCLWQDSNYVYFEGEVIGSRDNLIKLNENLYILNNNLIVDRSNSFEFIETNQLDFTVDLNTLVDTGLTEDFIIGNYGFYILKDKDNVYIIDIRPDWVKQEDGQYKSEFSFKKLDSLSPETLTLSKEPIYSYELPNYREGSKSYYYLLEDDEDTVLLITHLDFFQKGSYWSRATRVENPELEITFTPGFLAYMPLGKINEKEIEFFNQYFWRLEDKIYYINHELEGVDADSFDTYTKTEGLEEAGYFAFDKNNVYLFENKLNLDPVTFKTNYNWTYFKDQNGVYNKFGEKLDVNVSDGDFEKSNSTLKDENKLYFEGELVEGIDVEKAKVVSYKCITDGEKVFEAKSLNFDYKFFTNQFEIIDRTNEEDNWCYQRAAEYFNKIESLF